MIPPGFPRGSPPPHDPAHFDTENRDRVPLAVARALPCRDIGPVARSLRRITLSHVLLSGTVDRYPGLHGRLVGWGYTVGPAGDPTVAPDVGMCDVVIHVATAGADPGAMPDGAQVAGGAAAAAPLLVLGAEGPVPGAFETLPEPGPAQIRLRAAIARAEARARQLREGPGGDDRRGFHQFLGHELRSPLAALKTALDVVRRETDIEPAVGRMVDLASRNVDRLAGAVEWSQDLREIEETSLDPQLDEIPVGDLVAHLEKDGRRIDLVADPACPVVTDPALMATVAGQLERVVATCHPRGDIAIVIEAAGDCLNLVLTAEGAPRPVGGLQMGEPAGDAPEVERLARLMCSPCLLQILGLDPVAHEDAEGRSGLAVALPLAAPLPVS